MTFYTTPINIVDIEPTSFCNAKCPHCLRETYKGDDNFINNNQFDESFFDIFLRSR